LGHKFLLPLIALLMAVAAGCTPGSTTTTPPPEYSRYELEYRLLADFSDFFWCDPDLYPIARPDQEETDSQEQFPDIRADSAEFSAILGHLGLADKADYTDTEKLAIYREYKKLGGAVQMTPLGNFYDFSLKTGVGKGKLIRGTISTAGVIKVDTEETSYNTCPICLAAGTLIDTPEGPVPVEALRPGMEVWTVDEAGRPFAAALLATSATPVPPSFYIIRLTLADGRSVTASPGHPTAAGRALGSYRIGENLDGSVVANIESLPYDGGKTYDLLPSGVSGCYRSNGILLKSTLAR
jgi:hypothetical protein